MDTSAWYPAGPPVTTTKASCVNIQQSASEEQHIHLGSGVPGRVVFLGYQGPLHTSLNPATYFVSTERKIRLTQEHGVGRVGRQGRMLRGSAFSPSRTCLQQVRNADFIHREEGRGRAVLWAHVGNCSSVSDGQLGHSWPEKLHKFAHDPNLPEVLYSRNNRKV